MNEELKNRIEEILNNHKVILFMKGEKDMPMCGFSANAVEMINQYYSDFDTYNILEDEEVRQGLKEYSEWPTYPQLYVNGELVGGHDILNEMYENDELKDVFENVK